MTATTATQGSPFRPMPAEPWGWRFKRAREQVAGLTMDEAIELAGTYVITSKATISRLEHSPEAPTVFGKDRTRRQLAYILCLAYGVDPAEFDLSPRDVPPGVMILPRSDGRPSTIWLTLMPSSMAA